MGGDPETFEKGEADESTLLDVLGQASKALEADDVPFVLIGGIPSAVYGRPRATHDIDIFVKPEDADRALQALDGAGFETKKEEDEWLYKAMKDKVLIDVIFRAEGNFYLDDEMVERARETDFKGQRVKLVPPEDLLIMKAVSHEEETSHYWHDALALLVKNPDLDWDYVVGRAHHGTKRILSLLVYAQSSDMYVPDEPIKALYEKVYAQDGSAE